ncbi:LOW QUALITY PROTEIN: synaptotagmin-4-like [Pristis pectinata]|uniref:LOW QUALITY PROTEIN: synaptotagmin-4-like n=1 Tax=Pristis pectinata TaxID=685728 RepID=UPI00223E6510|nr:LOW QUALITY PROTEIN: synaptotagmin-4-like [Pristis pectinata]
MHLQVLLGAGLAFLCFCLIIGCAICWRKGKHRDPTNVKDQALERIVLDSNAGLLGNTSMPVKQQYEEVEGSVLDYPQSAISNPPTLATNASLVLAEGPSLPFIPVIQKASLTSKTRRILERRCTVSGDSSDYKEPAALGSSVAKPLGPMLGHSQTAPDSLTAMKTKPKPLLHFTLFYSSYELTLTVSVIGIDNLPKKFGSGCHSYVRVHLLPKIMETQQTAVRRKSLNPEFRESFQFSGYTLEEIRCFKLRFATYVKEFHNLKDTFVGELLFPLEQADWKLDTPFTYTMELTTTKTKLKKCFSTQDMASPTSSALRPKLVGQLFILLQYQTLANRIKVMVRKAETLARLTRIPGSPDHCVIINLYKDGKVISSKETKTSSGYNPVWNAPFLFDIPPGDIESLDLSLEFIVMQGRIYTRSCILGRVLIGANASETGRMHWKEMSSRGHVESARWHTIQSDAF